MSTEVLHMTIGERIRKLRESRGISVIELADKLGKARSTIYRYESDEVQDMPITVLEPLAEALETTPAYLMGWTDESDKAELRLGKYLDDQLRTIAREKYMTKNQLATKILWDWVNQNTGQPA